MDNVLIKAKRETNRYNFNYCTLSEYFEKVSANIKEEELVCVLPKYYLMLLV